MLRWSTTNVGPDKGAEVEKSKAGKLSGACKASLEITTNILVSWGPNISVGVDTEKNSSVLFEFV